MSCDPCTMTWKPFNLKNTRKPSPTLDRGMYDRVCLKIEFMIYLFELRGSRYIALPFGIETPDIVI